MYAKLVLTVVPTALIETSIHREDTRRLERKGKYAEQIRVN
jgi:hypothetical protein